jgi:dolichol-phosphate mannosyltransferase
MRAWRGDTLRAVLPATLRARGYAVQVETLARAVRGGARVIEVPILPRPRGHGRSKLDLAIGWEALWRIPTWR